MIEKANAIEVFKKNILRTESLIVAMEKLKAYNRLYQMNIEKSYPYNAKIDKQIQDKELSNIEKSCGEHAIISLVTAFETYYKELLQQLLSEYSTFLMSIISHDRSAHRADTPLPGFDGSPSSKRRGRSPHMIQNDISILTEACSMVLLPYSQTVILTIKPEILISIMQTTH